MATAQTPITLEIALQWAKSGSESEKVYRFLFLHPDDLFSNPRTTAWPIAHQVVYHGNVTLLKRILALFYGSEIDIHTRAIDQNTLLDVATEQRHTNEEMYNYVQQLFHQDNLIRAARRRNWPVVQEILQSNPT